MILYHGTIDFETYIKIMEKGVRKFSYWTPDLRVALTMGGPYVVAAFFYEYHEIPFNNCQIVHPKVIKPKDFLATFKGDIELKTYNKDADRRMRKVFKQHDKKKWCKHCDGHGEMTYLNDGHWWEVGGCRFDDKVYKKPSRSGPVTICPKCKPLTYNDTAF